MRPDSAGFWRGAWRGLLAIVATYVAFLLFAQFGFLTQVQRDLAAAGQVKAVMAAMGIAGLAASLGTAWLLGRLPAVRLVRIGLGAVAVVAVVSVVCHGFPSLFVIAAGIGASIGLLTVALATALPEMVPGRVGLAAGFGTGVAYFLSNIPVLFEAVPMVRALFPAGLAVVALALRPHPPNPPLPTRRAPSPGEGGTGRLEIGRLVVIFLVLVWLDSAAFAIVQANPGLKAQTWGTAGQKIVQGGVHLVAAVGAGALLDAGFGLAVPLAAWALFAIAFPLLQQPGGSAVAGPLYAVGISLYSTALVVMPTWRAPSSPPSRWRAGLLYGIAGWLGSALGVGMAQDLGRIPNWFLLATGATLAFTLFLSGSPLARGGGKEGRERGVRGVRALCALSLLGLLAVALQSQASTPSPDEIRQGGEAAAIHRGRQVYIAEGCIHCHSQYVRPGTHDETWWGPAQALDREEAPPLVGTRRQGPDLSQVGNRRSAVWQEIHLRDPRVLNPASRMPSYAHLFAGDGQRGRDLVAYLMSLGAETGAERWELSSRKETAPPPAPSSPVRGAALFASYCAACHGAEARGDGPLAGQLGDPYVNLRKAGFHSLPAGATAAEEKQFLARIIRHGLPPTSMPGHEWLTGRQVADLAAYVETLPARSETR